MSKFDSAEYRKGRAAAIDDLEVQSLSVPLTAKDRQELIESIESYRALHDFNGTADEWMHMMMTEGNSSPYRVIDAITKQFRNNLLVFATNLSNGDHDRRTIYTALVAKFLSESMADAESLGISMGGEPKEEDTALNFGFSRGNNSIN